MIYCERLIFKSMNKIEYEVSHIRKILSLSWWS